jgi:hypothetical protein
VIDEPGIGCGARRVPLHSSVSGGRLCPQPALSHRFAVILALSDALSKDIGLIATFGGIGVVVNGLVVYIALQIRGERQQNLAQRASRRDGG